MTRNILRIGIKKQVLLILFPILVLLLSAMVIKPAQAQDLYTYAETSAQARSYDHDASGPSMNHSRSDSYALGSSAGGAYIIGGTSDVYVERVGGIAWGPCPLGQVWPYYCGIGCWGMGFGPMAGGGSAVGWFESNTPFNLFVEGASFLISKSGGGTTGWFLGGVNVTDMNGARVLYDVAIECGMGQYGGYFREINTVGNWPQPWAVTDPGCPLIFATQDSFTLQFTPVGLGRATLYVYMYFHPATSSGAPSSPSYPNGTLSSSSEEDSFKGYFSSPPAVGGFVVPVDKFGLLAPYIGLASTIMIGAVATAVYVKRIKRRKGKQ